MARGETITGEEYVRPAIWCAKGVPTEVPEDIAGRPPSGEPDAEDFDPGEGLLVLTHVWREATAEEVAYERRWAEALAKHPGDTSGDKPEPSEPTAEPKKARAAKKARGAREES
jgi:hypothetical protein